MKYLQTPREVYDIFIIFIYHFNEDRFKKLPSFVNIEELGQRIQTLIQDQTINDKLYMFFYAPEHEETFMGSHFIRFSDVSNPNYIINMCEKISSMDLFSEIISYYTKSERKNYSEVLSTDFLYDLLMSIDIPDKIRFQILHFNNNRGQYSEILKKELLEKYERLLAFYKNKLHIIEETKTKLLDKNNQKDLCKASFLDQDVNESYYYSISLLQDKLYFSLKCNEKCGVVIGYDTISDLQNLMLFENSIDLPLISRSLSDNFRIDILNYIKENGELTTTEIAKKFDKGLTAIFYHLNMLNNAQILNTRNEGRTVFYSINSNFLITYSTYIKEFATKGNAKL